MHNETHNIPKLVFYPYYTQKCVLECGLQKCVDSLESFLLVNWVSGLILKKKILQK